MPDGEYGDRAAAAFRTAVARTGGTLAGIETYDRGNTSIVSAATRLQQRGGFDAVLIADGARLAAQAAGVLRPRGTGSVRILGTELWSGESDVTRVAALRGALVLCGVGHPLQAFSDSYKARFGAQPYRISTLGYDAVLLALRIARDWRPGRRSPLADARRRGLPRARRRVPLRPQRRGRTRDGSARGARRAGGDRRSGTRAPFGG